MEIKEQIYSLSQNPIFFLSPNIGIKFSIIKEHTNYINKRNQKILELVENNMVRDLKEKKNFDGYYLTFLMMYYLNNRNDDLIKHFDIDSKIENLKGIDAFYANAFLAYYYYDNTNYEMAKAPLKFSMKYVENNPVSDYEKMCIYTLTADFLSKTQDIFISGAENYFIQALNLIKNDDLIGKISLLNSLAYYYHNVEKLDKAAEYINMALDLVKIYNFNLISFTTYKIAGIIYTTKGDFNTAKLYFTKAIDFTDQLDDEAEYVKLLNTLGYVEFLKGDFSDSFNNFEKALNHLILFSSTIKLLDESVKTFDNIGNILKFLGDIDTSIAMQTFGKEILENIHSMNRVNEVHNLSKIYTDIALTYLIYKENYAEAEKFFNLAVIDTDANEHYIKRNKKLVLESLLKLNKSEDADSDANFNSAIENLKSYGKNNLYVQQILIEFLIFYYKLKKKDSILDEAVKIAKLYKLEKHYEALYKIIFIEQKNEQKIIVFNKYSLNLIKLLALEKKEVLIQSKKSKHLEIIEEFITNISEANKEIKLFNIAENIFNKHFLSKGFIVIEKPASKRNLEIRYFRDFDTGISNDYEELIIPLLNKIDKQQIINVTQSRFIKSLLINRINCRDEHLDYYFILYNDIKSDWNFNFEELKTFGILINNLYLKLKSIKQLEKIELSSITDSMTGFRNASYYNKKIKELIKEYNNSGRQFALAIIDLNKFKLINDTYGHDIGDKTLKYFSKILKNKIKDNAEFIRYGGDEFILLLDAKRDIEKELKQIKKYFSSHPMAVNGSKLFIDFSYGVEIYSGQAESDIFKIADLKMYRQKQTNH